MTDTLTTEEIVERLLARDDKGWLRMNNQARAQIIVAALKGVEPKQDGWRDIVTAPLETPILFWCTGNPDYYEKPGCRVGVMTTVGAMRVPQIGCTVYTTRNLMFTAWQPLPGDWTPDYFSKQEVAVSSEGDDPQEEWNQFMSARVTTPQEAEPVGAQEVHLKPGWLAKDVERACKRAKELRGEAPSPTTAKWEDEIDQPDEDVLELLAKAKDSARRLIDKCWNNQNNERPRFSIPARPQYDDDMIVTRALMKAPKLIESLKEERADKAEAWDKLVARGKEVADLKAQVEKLRAALKPLANEADNFGDEEDDPDAQLIDGDGVRDITVGDCRRARAALSHPEGA